MRPPAGTGKAHADLAKIFYSRSKDKTFSRTHDNFLGKKRNQAKKEIFRKPYFLFFEP